MLEFSLQAVVPDASAGRTTCSEIDRRGVLLAMGATAAVGLDVASSPQVRAAGGSSGRKIDAHTHFAPLKFLDFAEKAEGRPFGLSPIFRSRPALTDVKSRIDMLDRNEIDVNVLVPTPWIEGFPKIYADPTLAVQAARLMNDELAAVVAAHPKRFRGVAILPVIDADAMVAELRRCVTELGFVGAFVAVGPTARRMDHPDYEHLYKAWWSWTPRCGCTRHVRPRLLIIRTKSFRCSTTGCWPAGSMTRRRQCSES